MKRFIVTCSTGIIVCCMHKTIGGVYLGGDIYTKSKCYVNIEGSAECQEIDDDDYEVAADKYCGRNGFTFIDWTMR